MLYQTFDFKICRCGSDFPESLIAQVDDTDPLMCECQTCGEICAVIYDQVGRIRVVMFPNKALG